MNLRLLPPLLVATTLLATFAGCLGKPTGPEPSRTKQEAAGQLVEISAGPDSQGEVRTAMVHVPDGYTAKKKWPVIWAFHGGRNTTAAQMVPFWMDRMDGEYILVFPNGQRSDPEVGAWYVEDHDGMRHVEVIDRLREVIAERWSVDEGRQYATGFSSGAQMTWQLACQRADRFAAFAPVAHYLLTDQAERCEPPVVRPLMLVGSTDDPRATYQGKIDPSDQSVHDLGADRSLAFWAKLAGCGGDPTSKDLPGAGGGVRLAYPGCTGALEHVRLADAGHTWPGRSKRGEPLPDRPDATALIVDFFEAAK